VEVSVGAGVSVGAAVVVDVKDGMGEEVSVEGRLVVVKTGWGVGEAVACPPLFSPQASVVRIRMMKGKNLESRIGSLYLNSG
jgi:predicted acyltransferase (DUF342 family)